MGMQTKFLVPCAVSIAFAMAVGSATHARFTETDTQRLVFFCELVAAAIASLDERATLEIQALTDPLTGLANRRQLRQRLDEELARALRHHRPLSVAMLDVDNLKQINDRGGHDVGDRALVEVASCLRLLARAEDTIGRRGGDEFMWILPDTDREDALAAVERARAMIATQVVHAGPTTVSAGIADTEGATDASGLMRLADVALYWSKTHGRDQARVYQGEEVRVLSSPEQADPAHP